MIPHRKGPSQQKTNLQKKSFTHYSKKLPREPKDSKNKPIYK